MHVTRWVRGVICGAALLWPAVGMPADHVLVVGGGPTPGNSQISIEKNIVYFRHVLQRVGRSDLEPYVLFASGPKASPDVCYDITDKVPRSYRLMADLFGDGKGINQSYRPHEIGPVQGPSERSVILDKLTEYSKSLHDGDRLFLYVTGHGGKGEPTTNGFLATWNNDRLPVKQLAEVLDKFQPGVEVVTVMVQCYSGCFANLLFEGGDPAKPLAKHKRAGFFATVDTRQAAGCTADIKVENYKEYSTSFYAGLCGQDRLGRSVKAKDIDGDGKISFAEAHAYTMLESDTIDICYRTSDRFLETQARVDPKDEKLLKLDQSLETLVSLADPVRRFLLEKLAKELHLKPANVVEDARKWAELISKQRKSLQGRIGKLDGTARQEGEKIKNDLSARWPFIRNPWHPETHKLLEQEGDELVKAIESHPSYKAWNDSRQRAKQSRDMDLQKERNWAKVERFLLVATSVVRAENLKREGKAELLEKYDQIMGLENSSLAAEGKSRAALAN